MRLMLLLMSDYLRFECDAVRGGGVRPGELKSFVYVRLPI